MIRETSSASWASLPGGVGLVVVVVRRPLEEGQGGDVPELAGRLHVQERSVETRQLLHGTTPRTAAPDPVTRRGTPRGGRALARTRPTDHGEWYYNRHKGYVRRDAHAHHEADR